MTEQLRSGDASPLDREGLVDWSIWRGGVDATLRGQDQRITDMGANLIAVVRELGHTLGERIDRSDREFAKRLDSQDQVLERVDETTQRHDKDLALIQSNDEDEDEQKHRSLQIRGIYLSTGAVLAAAVVGGVVTELASKVLG